ncbi:MAG TPA: molybdopterin cofactor-binding domain-containing protein [Pyrinomonadaceae bacterium]|nr:molybdopterin cofactor-binding domain-containing protein [Pyrinomonadaceae bacterium]
MIDDSATRRRGDTESEDEVFNSIEPERYELFEAAGYNFNLDRRGFLKTFGLGILLIVPATRVPSQQGESGGGRFNDNAPKEVGAWIHIDENGVVTAYTGKVEFGQNIRTSLTQAVAEELHVPPTSVRIVMGDTELTPFDMGTFGSLTTPLMAPQLRKAAAAAREILTAMAAEQLKLQPNELRIVNARFVNHDESKTLTLAEVAKGRKLVKVIPDNIAITKPSDWTIAGKSLTKVDAADFVTGKHRYTSDFNREGMVYGRVVRPATLNAKLSSANTKAAEALPGVKVVVDGDFIGVTAPKQETANKAAKLIVAEWQSPPQPSQAELFELLRKPATERRGGGEGRGRGARTQGSIAEGMAAAEKKLSETYTVAYIAHAPLEPRAAVAEWTGDKLTVWTGTQRPFGVQGELAEAFHISEDKIRVIVPDTGSGYGGKHTGECAVEAARLARAAGKPVRLVWTREEEFNWAYFRPAGVIDIKSGVKSDGTITAWEFHNYNSGSAGIQIKYDIANHDIRFHSSNSPLRQGSYRGLAATANHFARESHMDELAFAVKMDPIEFRLKNIKDERLRDVLQAATKAFGWGKTKPANGHGFGLACGFEKGGYVATCAEIAIEKPRKTKGNPTVRIVRVVEAFECGAIVNPLHLKNQIEGCIAQAVGGALFEEIKFENGKILNGRFADYRLPRFSDNPLIEIVLVDRKDLPSAGAGETPIVGLAPAVANAIFNATGVRIRSLPLVPKGIPLTTPAQ